MIESIHIKNFRGIQDGKIDKFSKINLLVGPNNSGKSAVLESIYLCSTTSRNAIMNVENIQHVGKIDDTDLLGDYPIKRVCERHSIGIEKEPFEGIQYINPGISFRFGIEIPLRDIVPSIFSMDGEALINQPRVAKEVLALFSWHSDEVEVGKYSVKRSSRIVYGWNLALSHYKSGESSWLITGEKTVTRKVLFYDVSNTQSHLPFEFFRSMLMTVPGWTQKIGKQFGRVFALSKQFNVNFFQPQDALHLTQGLISPEDKIALTIDDYGDGARSGFKMLAPLIALAELVTEEEPGVFIWEEPELFQNPQSLGKLLAEVTQLIKDKPIQIFIATHSIEVIGQFVRLVTEKAIAEDEMLAIRLNLQDGQLSSSAFNHQDIQDWTAMHLDLRVPDGRVDSPLKFQLAEAANDDE